MSDNQTVGATLPPWGLPILRVATGGHPYKPIFATGYTGLGNYKNPSVEGEAGFRR